MTRSQSGRRRDERRPLTVRGKPGVIGLFAAYFVGLFVVTLVFTIVDPPDWPGNLALGFALIPFGWIAWRCVSLLRAAIGTALRVDANGVFRAGVTKTAIPWSSMAGEPQIRKAGAIRTIVIPVREDDPAVRLADRLEERMRPVSHWLNDEAVIDIIAVSLNIDIEALHAELMDWYLDGASIF